MVRKTFLLLATIVTTQIILSCQWPRTLLAQEWQVKVKPRGILKVVDLTYSSVSVRQNYSEGLVSLNNDNQLVPCLAEDWSWIDDRTIEFKLREDVTFHNGEAFNAGTVKVNWEAYRKMKRPYLTNGIELRDEMELKIANDYTIQFVFRKPDGLALPKIRLFYLFASPFFLEHEFVDQYWGFLPRLDPGVRAYLDV